MGGSQSQILNNLKKIKNVALLLNEVAKELVKVYLYYNSWR